jgi:hypothetical protein
MMTDSSEMRRDKNKFQKWLCKWPGTNRGTHWTVAGSVAVIILGGYLISTFVTATLQPPLSGTSERRSP